MDIYALKNGILTYYVAATDEDHAYEQGRDAQRFPDMYFLPFTASKIEIEGVTITATSNDTTEAPRRTRKAASQ